MSAPKTAAAHNKDLTGRMEMEHFPPTNSSTGLSLVAAGDYGKMLAREILILRSDLSRAQESRNEAVGILHAWVACMGMRGFGWATAAKLLTVRTNGFLHRLATEDAKPSPERENAKPHD